MHHVDDFKVRNSRNYSTRKGKNAAVCTVNCQAIIITASCAQGSENVKWGEEPLLGILDETRALHTQPI